MKPFKFNHQALLLISCFACPLIANATIGQATYSNMTVGRYSSMLAAPEEHQYDILSTMVQTRFPQRISTVGEALDYLLLRSGYRLAKYDATDPEMEILMTRPLPETHRDIGPMTLEDALQTLASPIYRIVIDPLNRLISFEVIEEYKSLVPQYVAEDIAGTELPAYMQKRTRHSIVGKPAGKLGDNELKIDEAQRFKQDTKRDEDISVFPIESGSEVEIIDDQLSFGFEESSIAFYEPLDDYEVNDFIEEGANQTAASSVNQYHGPVQSNESLATIASKYATELGVSNTKMMYGIFRLNSQNFGKVEGEKNVNQLFKDALIKIPSEHDLASINDKHATRIIAQHNAAWNNHLTP